MYIQRDLSLKVSKSLFGTTSHYYLNQHITILTNDDTVLKGTILSILSDSLEIKEDSIGSVSVLYENIKDIADTDWLCDDDIRDVFNTI